MPEVKRKTAFADNLKLALCITALPWLVFLLDLVFPMDLTKFGILPRHSQGLWGILFSPFLHVDLWHIMANTGGLFCLTLLGMFLDRKATLWAIVIIIILGGLGVWAFGSLSYHIGASGLVFGLFGFLLASGWIRRDFKAIAISVAVFLLYGGLFFSLLRVMPGISWSAHFWGFAAGLCAAFFTRPRRV